MEYDVVNISRDYDKTSGTGKLTLVKGEHTHIFRYSQGREAEIIEAFAELASNPNSGFNWFDAAVLSYELGRIIESDLEKL